MRSMGPGPLRSGIELDAHLAREVSTDQVLVPDVSSPKVPFENSPVLRV